MVEGDTANFGPLAEGLSAEQRSEFFQVLHLAGITRQDIELARLLRALQLYKAFYEEIPSRLNAALKEADALGRTFTSLHESVSLRLDRTLGQLERNAEAASRVSEQFREAKTVIASAIQKSTRDVAETLEFTLRKSLAAGLLTPFEKFVNDIKDRCSRMVSEAEQISLQLKQARRIHIGGYALAAMVLTLVLTGVVWINAARHYAEREDELVQQIHQNRLVLSELARKRATLKVQRDRNDPSKLYLIIERATAWTADKDAIVELK